MKFVDLKKSLKEKILPCYNLSGDDIFLLYKSLDLIKSATIPQFPDFNLVVFGEKQSYSANDVIDSCLSLPIGTDLRLVVVYDCQLKPTDDNKKVFENYLSSPNDKSCLVFFNSSKNEFAEKLKNCEKVDCNKLSIDLVKKLIAQKCFNEGKAINVDASELLAHYCLNNLARIYGELDKIVCYVGENKLITKEDIENNVIKELEFEIYEFAQSVAQKNSDRAFEIMDELLAGKDNVGMILSSLYNQFSRMFFISISKGTNNELSKILGVKEFAISKNRELITFFSKKQLKNIVELISLKEFEMKSGMKSAQQICENLIFNIMKVM